MVLAVGGSAEVLSHLRPNVSVPARNVTLRPMQKWKSWKPPLSQLHKTSFIHCLLSGYGLTARL